MDQVSRPMLIALSATVVLAALWLVALRPKDDNGGSSEPAAPATPVDAQIKAVDKAKEAAAATDAATAKTQAATGEGPAQVSATPAKPDVTAAKPAAPKPAPAASKPAKKAAASPEVSSGRVLAAMEQNKVVVLLFQNPKAADDRAVRKIVNGIDRRKGKVVVSVASINQVGSYEAITRGVQINQSPTILVIDRDQKARTIVGFSDKHEVSQAVGDALAGR